MINVYSHFMSAHAPQIRRWKHMGTPHKLAVAIEYCKFMSRGHGDDWYMASITLTVCMGMCINHEMKCITRICKHCKSFYTGTAFGHCKFCGGWNFERKKEEDT